jgi:hypothetical protein
MKFAAGLAAGLMVVSGCTKERPVKPVGKSDLGTTLISKSVLTTGPDSDAEYMYVGSALESSRKSTAARPYWMGDGYRVKFQFTEKALRVIAPEKDGRFAENPTNAQAVLTIPIENIDYKCVEDDFGDCTRSEEENDQISWDKRNYFRLKPEELEAQQISFMPVDIANWVTGGYCYKETGSELVSADWKEDGVNIILEKTYTGSPGCIDWAGLDSFQDVTFTVRYQHSFKKLNQLTGGRPYKTIEYTRDDESNFGFFNTDQDRLAVDNNDNVSSRTMMFDRWNPNRDKVVYHMTENFNKPENAAIKAATYKAFEALNDGLAKAGAKMRLELQEPVKGLSSGDLNNNMIVMVDDPLGVGLIGYGPHVSNPLTGEILHARTVMYLGTIKKYIRYDYDNLIEERLQATAAPITLAASAASPRRSIVIPQSVLAGTQNSVKPNSVHTLAKIPGDIVDHRFELDKLAQLPVYDRTNDFYLKNLKEKIQALSRNCEYPAELFNFEDAIGDGIDAVIDEVGMKPWDDLTDAEKQKVMDVLIPYVWVPTLVHEMGHNLGLRHNFAGSEDKDNFYTAEEMQKMGVKRPFKYSSVMDYAYRVNNELHTLGKYDIAALKYGYSERVELKDGTEVSLDDFRKNKALELKPYAYCTDEHADVNPNCNRFDEGTNLAEIAQHYVRAYEKRYTRANFRNNRRKFSLLRDSAQMGALDDTFFNLRLMFERYETIKNTFDLADDAKEWNDIPFLKELKDATITAGNFYLNVLKTPDTMCAVALASKPNQVIAVVPIRLFSKRAITCFDTEEVRLNPQYVIVAEGGKSFQSRKAVSNPNPYADEIDVRGIWIDKLLATQYLFSRTLGSTLFDVYTENLMHMPELQAPIQETLNQIITDDLVGPVTFHTPDGFKVDFNVGYRLFNANDADNSHKIPPLIDDAARQGAGLPEKDVTLFHTFFVQKMLELSADKIHVGMTEAMVAPYRVYSLLPHDGRESEYRFVEVGDKRYFARKQAGAVMALMDGYDTTTLLAKLTDAQIAKVLAAADDTALNEDEKAAFALGKETVQKYADGGFQASSYYALMIKSLAGIFTQ